MKTRIVFSCVAALAATAAFAQADVIKARQEAMKATGGKTAIVGKMLKGEEKFELAKAQDALTQYVMIGEKGPSMFPAGSQNGDTAALPPVWTNKADFEAKFAKLASEAKAAQTAVKDEASFKATMPELLKNCGGCHETYRAKKS